MSVVPIAVQNVIVMIPWNTPCKANQRTEPQLVLAPYGPARQCLQDQKP